MTKQNVYFRNMHVEVYVRDFSIKVSWSACTEYSLNGDLTIEVDGVDEATVERMADAGFYHEDDERTDWTARFVNRAGAVRWDTMAFAVDELQHRLSHAMSAEGLLAFLSDLGFDPIR